MNAPADPIQTFCDYYHPYHAISKQRRIMQTRVLRDLESHLPGDILAIESDQLRAFASSLVNEREFHPNTVRQYLNSLKPFYTWLWEGKLISGDTLLGLRSIKPPRGATGMSRPNPYSPKEIDRFWHQLEVKYPWGKDGTLERAQWYLKRWQNGTSRWNRVQPYAKRLQIEAVIALALYGGLRRDEIYNLVVEEMHPDNEYIVVRSKKNKEGELRVRAVPWMSDAMSKAVGDWLEFRELMAPEHDSPWLSLHQDKHRLKAMRHTAFKALLGNVGTGWELHRMRHTAATVMVRTGMQLERASKILGHSRLEQTLQYAKIDTTDLISAAKRARTYYGKAFARPDTQVA